MQGRTYGTTELKLPTFKSNIQNDAAFHNVKYYFNKLIFILEY